MAKPTAQEFVAALRRVEEEGDVDAMARLYADDARLLNPTERTEHVGPDGARRFWEAYRKSFDSVRSRFLAVLESDARIMLEWTSECRTAAGLDTSYDGVSVVETHDGRITRFSAYFDPAQLTAHAPVEAAMRPSGQAPMADQAPRDDLPGDATRGDEAPRDEAPRDEAPRDEAPREEAPPEGGRAAAGEAGAAATS